MAQEGRHLVFCVDERDASVHPTEKAVPTLQGNTDAVPHHDEESELQTLLRQAASETQDKSIGTHADGSGDVTFLSSATAASQSNELARGSWCRPQPGTKTPGPNARDVSSSCQLTTARGVVVRW